MRTVVNGGKVTAAPQPMFQPCAAVHRAFTRGMGERAIDVTPDGARFLDVSDPADGTAPAINVIVNWQSRLKP